MNIKKVFTVLLLVFVAGSVAYMVVNERAGVGDVPDDDGEVVVDGDSEIFGGDVVEKRQVVVYYFHGDVRCPTCHKLENYAKESVDTYFGDAVAGGELVWRPVNVDQPGNAHYVKDYQLVTKAVVLSEVVDGKESKWKNLDQIWDLVGDKNVYIEYIREGVSAFIGEK